MNSKRNLIILIVCFIYSLLINTFYRPYIYINHLSDFGIADIGNNLAFIPGVYFLTNIIRNKYIISKYYDIWLCLLLFGTIEFFSYFFPFLGTFDIKDVFGLLIGAIILFYLVKNEK